ncbi:MAG: CHAP domain-containing protein [Chloroflexota bacterium]|nr:CHAP domain-containing protein [Chloroflexota bacterium]MDQ6898254.1 CHAP domain-containing protein [Candidatus Dormibacteraeota bacterium]
MKLLAGGLGAVLVVPGALFLLLLSSAGASRGCGLPTGGALPGLDAAAATNAGTIVTTTRAGHLSDRAAVIALAVAIQESGLHNIDHGTSDSLGLFQQRPSQGWGTPAQVMDPVYATTAFLRHLVAVPLWDRLPLGLAAQAVQRSADLTGQSYQRWEAKASAILAGLGSCTSTMASTFGQVVVPVLRGPVGSLVTVANDPVFGKAVPNSFPWGQCTWFVASNRQVTWTGDAWQWWAAARSAGRPESTTPTVGSIVVYQRGMGWSGFGHVALVLAVWGSTFTVEEANVVGVGVVDQRIAAVSDPAISGFVG